MFRLTGEHGTDLDTLNRRVLDSLCDRLGNLLTGGNDQLAGRGMDNIMYGNTTKDTLIKGRDGLIAILQGGAYQATERSAVLLIDNHVV